MDFDGRKEMFRALVGSHNYNLNTPESDKDYKIFVAPTFDDLYFNKEFSSSHIGKEMDYEVHDIRKVSKLWWKANVNFLEVLFSEDFKKNVEGTYYYTGVLIEKIYNMRNDIARMNLPYLYDACIGMHITKKKQVEKGTEGTQHLVDAYGYDTKQAMHSLRILDFLKRFADNDFTDFKTAIWYYSSDLNREWMLDVKNGKYSKTKYYDIAADLLNEAENGYKLLYKTQLVDTDTHEELTRIVKEIVKNQLY